MTGVDAKRYYIARSEPAAWILRRGLGDRVVSDVALTQRLPAEVGDAAPAVERGSQLSKAFAAGFAVLLLLAVLSPIVENRRARPHDDFPLSYFPMFADERSDAQSLHYVVGLDAAGNRLRVAHNYIAPGGMNQVRRQMNKLVGQGKAREICAAASAEIARRRPRALREVTTLQVVTGTFGMSEYFSGNRAPISERVTATCRVAR